ncbi:MAG: hypothetical protein MZU91_12570 [Desulfosudis oleivorans]|nr:hypothetical protein [Desulfosudis oleivorans]
MYTPDRQLPLRRRHRHRLPGRDGGHGPRGAQAAQGHRPARSSSRPTPRKCPILQLTVQSDRWDLVQLRTLDRRMAAGPDHRRARRGRHRDRRRPAARDPRPPRACGAGQVRPHAGAGEQAPARRERDAVRRPPDRGAAGDHRPHDGRIRARWTSCAASCCCATAATRSRWATWPRSVDSHRGGARAVARERPAGGQAQRAQAGRRQHRGGGAAGAAGGSDEIAARAARGRAAWAMVENQATYVVDALSGVQSAALEAAVLVVLIVWLFLGSLAAGGGDRAWRCR